MGDIKDIIQADFSNADGNAYIVLPPQVLHAGNYGVPESRERVIFIGVRKNALKEETAQALEGENIPADLYPYPRPTHCCTLSDGTLAAPVVLQDVLGKLKEPEDSFDPSQRFYSKANTWEPIAKGKRKWRWTKSDRLSVPNITATSNTADCLRNTGGLTLMN